MMTVIMPMQSHRTTLLGSRQRYLLAVWREAKRFFFLDIMALVLEEVELDDFLNFLEGDGKDASVSESEQVEYSSSEQRSFVGDGGYGWL